ncbi:NAD(P)-dependent oxidoreductase [[Mycobacterium] burgundiense]|uniref:NAD(P)-dependent oxidoreductase n=1 Tax=[Mycobacterium] burgundiense TaxID=3064286 RepID=A0ABN9N6F7_9MYCO|nr:NAD(P)-dependent oxidoreductase [Mycolicibacterium sp. MU0053]CAJ1499434.1 NAD(P)-dependent oxidoreductase [Mycolicibacterium sp. MU0053]
MTADLGFIGLGHMGMPMLRRLLAAGHSVTVFDTRREVVEAAVGLGAHRASDPTGVADRAPTVLASLPGPAISVQVAEAVAEAASTGGRIARFVDLSTVGSPAARRIHGQLAARGIAALDCPVSGGVHGAEQGTLALMVSGSRTEFDIVDPVLQILGRTVFVGESPGAAQTMKLVNNMLAATALAATAEAMVMGVRAGLDPAVMIDVLNASSGGTHASRDKFPRAVLPRTFDYGFATGLMVKDIRLYLEEAHILGVPTEIVDGIARCWETTVAEEGAESDFTSVVKPIERAAGVTVAARPTPNTA